MKVFDAYEFGIFINNVKENIRQIENGSQVFNGMMHKDRVISELRQIVMLMEAQSELMTKYVIELERKAKAYDENLENEYRLLKNFVDYMPISYRKRNANWVIVMRFLQNGTSKGGSTSSKEKCRMLGINPDGYTLEREGE
jgi:hypothetical protein